MSCRKVCPVMGAALILLLAGLVDIKIRPVAHLQPGISTGAGQNAVYVIEIITLNPFYP